MGLLLLKCSNGTVTVQKTNRKGESSKRKSAFVSREIQSILIKKQNKCVVPRDVCTPPDSLCGYTSDAVSVELRTRVVRILYS